MKSLPKILVAIVILGLSIITAWAAFSKDVVRFSDTEFEQLEQENEPPVWLPSIEALYSDWQRPPGPLRVGLQVGHWKNSELPEELDRLIGNTGATGGGKTESEVNMAIAQATASLLEPRGIVVDILPATVPPEYLADLFIAIHADASPSSAVRGFKVAAPRRDLTRRGPELETIFEAAYQAATDFQIDPNVTRNMRGYYAFNWRRNVHAIHPMTPAIILETGFLTNPADQQILIHNPRIAAEGIAQAVFTFLQVEPVEGGS